MRKVLVYLLLVVPMLFSVTAVATAETGDDVTTYSALEDVKLNVEKSLDLTLVREDLSANGIRHFDVSPEGKIALGFGQGMNSRICVFDQKGIFQYAYKFSTEQGWAIAFQGENVGIYLVRSELIAVYDSEGTCVDVLRIYNTRQNMDATRRIYYRTRKQVSQKQYYLDRDINLGQSYSRLITVDESGNTNVLYDASVDVVIGQIIGTVSAVAFFVLAIWLMYKKQIELDEAE